VQLVLGLAHENTAIEFEMSLIQSIPKIGRYSAILLRAEIGDFS